MDPLSVLPPRQEGDAQTLIRSLRCTLDEYGAQDRETIRGWFREAGRSDFPTIKEMDSALAEICYQQKNLDEDLNVASDEDRRRLGRKAAGISTEIDEAGE